MAPAYLNKLYESEQFTQLAMDTADNFLQDIEMEDEVKTDLAFMLLELIKLTEQKYD